MKKQFGLAHPVVITILVIGLIGALGFIFWQNFVTKSLEAKDDKQVSKQGDMEKGVVPDQTESTQSIPDGYVAYKDKALGFSFAYPKDWGELKATQNQSSSDRLGANGENTKTLIDVKGSVRIAVYKKDSFLVKLQSGYVMNFQGGKVIGNYGPKTEDEVVNPIAGTNAYADGGGESGDVNISWGNLFFESGDSVVYVYTGTMDVQTQIAKTIKVE